jgi:hypothetical protein
MSTKRTATARIDQRVAPFITYEVTLSPDSWTATYEMFDQYLYFTRYDDDQMDRREFAAALRTVPGVRAERRGKKKTWGLRGLLLDERAPVDKCARAFRLLAAVFGDRQFEVHEVAQLVKLNWVVAGPVFREAGCLKFYDHTVRDWLRRARDYSRDGYTLRLVGALSEGRWRLVKKEMRASRRGAAA